MTTPGIVRAVEASAEAHRKAMVGLVMLTREVTRLRAEIAERDVLIGEQNQHISTLREMLERSVAP